MGLWDGIDNAEIYERGNYVKSGFSGVVKIMKTLAKDTRATGVAFIVEMEVIETNMPGEHPIGSKVTWFQKMADKNVAFPAVAAWAAACVGFDTSQKEQIKSEVMPVLKDLMNAATDKPEENDFVGTLLRLDTIMVKTKEKKLDFTRYDFKPYERAA